jgi:NTE family protein
MDYNLNYDTLCLAGCGPSGFTYISVLKKLYEKNIFIPDKIKKFVGTSIGSILCFFLIIDYKLNELLEFIKNFNFSYLEQEVDCEKFLNNYGLNDGKKFIILLKTFILKKYNKNDITFKELFENTGKELFIIATNYTNCKEELFNHINTPDLNITDAIRMSISLPIFFTPVNYKEELLIDGGFTNNLGLNYCDPDTTLTLCCYKEKNKKPHNIMDYIYGLKSVISRIIIEKHMNSQYKKNLININSIHFTFSPNKKDIEKLISDGYEIADTFIKNKPKIFCRDIVFDLINNLNT